MKFKIVIAPLFLLTATAWAQVALANAPAIIALPPMAPALSKATTDEQPWLYKGSDIPVDSSWTFGTLENGLRYAVKKNDVPAGQVSVRVAIDAGSLNEAEDEQGFAHLIEHLSFRGSTYVPDGEAKRIWQRFGVTFGSDSNAQTTETQTVYKLDLPNATPETLNESFKILSGMIRAPRIDDAALNAERAIVSAEWREDSGAQMQMADALRTHFFQGQLLAVRSTIGTAKTLAGASAVNLSAFHDRWYRPDKAIVAIAGDAEPSALVALVKNYFGDWHSGNNVTPDPDFGSPKASGNVAKVAIIPNLPLSVNIAYLRPWHQVNDNIAYNQQLLVESLALQIINRRLEVAAREGGSFLSAQVGKEDYSRSANITSITVRPIGNDWAKAIHDVRAVIADASATSPSVADIEREKKLFADTLRTDLDSYPFEAAGKQADDIVNAVNIRETVATPQVVLDVYHGVEAQLTPDRLFAATKAIFSGIETRAVLSLPKPQKGAEAALANAINTPVMGKNLRLTQNNIGFDALPKLGAAGRIIQRSKNDKFDVEQLSFANGVQALLSPNKAENGQIRLLVRFGKGYQSVSPRAINYFWPAETVIADNGIGALRRTQIDQMTNGRRMDMHFNIDSDAFELSAITRPEDLADQMTLLATKMQYPGWDSAPIARVKALALQGRDSYDSSATAVLQRDLDYMLTSKDLRWKSPNEREINALTSVKFRSFWQPLLASGPIEVSLFGDFDRDKAILALQKSFGAMHPRKSWKAPKDAKLISFPAPTAKPIIAYHKGPTDQAATVIAWPTGGGRNHIEEGRHLEVLSAIFRDRLFEKFRSEQAVSYSPDTNSNWPEDFPNGGYFMAYSQLQPKDADRFYSFAQTVADDLAAKPVSADELARAIEPIKKSIDRSSSGNGFWLSQIKGVSVDPTHYDALSHLYSDYSDVNAAEIQALAKRYFRKNKAWMLTVLPADNVAR